MRFLLKITKKLNRYKYKLSRFLRNKTFSDDLKSYLNPEDTITEDYKDEIINYWSKYTKIDPNFHNLYISRSGIEDLKYIPRNVFFNDIIPFYNNNELSKAFSDKSYSSFLFKDVKRPIVIAKNINGLIYDDNFNILSFDEMINRCSKNKRVIIKPSIDSGAGKGIVFVESKEKEKMKIKTANVVKKFGNNYVIQEIIEQHKVMKNLNASSINTIRVMSYLNKDGVNVLSSHVRIGTDNNEVDHNGIISGISNQGIINDFAIDYNNRKKLFKHPQGYEFKGVKIPGFCKIADIVSKEHLKLGHFRIASWDFSIDQEEEPILIEVNLRGPGIDNHQLTSGPLFGDLTDEILNEVFNSNKKEMYFK